MVLVPVLHEITISVTNQCKYLLTKRSKIATDSQIFFILMVNISDKIVNYLLISLTYF